MDEEYKPMISDEERAARRAQRAESRRKKRRARRMRQLRRLVPCGLLAVLCVGLVTVGAQLIEKPRPEVGKAGRPFQPAAAASDDVAASYTRAVSDTDTVQLGEDFPSRCAVLIDLDDRTVLAEKNADTLIDPASMTKVLTVLVAGHITPMMPWVLAFAAGAMIYVVVEELIPEAHLGEHSHTGTASVMAGFLVMMLLDVLLG